MHRSTSSTSPGGRSSSPTFAKPSTLPGRLHLKSSKAIGHRPSCFANMLCPKSQLDLALKHPNCIKVLDGIYPSHKIQKLHTISSLHPKKQRKSSIVMQASLGTSTIGATEIGQNWECKKGQIRQQCKRSIQSLLLVGNKRLQRTPKKESRGKGIEWQFL